LVSGRVTSALFQQPVKGLIEALDDLSDRLGPDGAPLSAIIVSARPLAARLAIGLDDITTLGEAKSHD
jgi:hypothetical protein